MSVSHGSDAGSVGGCERRGKVVGLPKDSHEAVDEGETDDGGSRTSPKATRPPADKAAGHC